ncbi:MAG: transglutaminase family protein [Planctomycetota bacterium]
MKRYRIMHRTTYGYASPVSLCQNEAHLIPRELPWQRCLRSSLEVEPRPAEMSERVDFFGNKVHYFAIQELHSTLVVTARSDIELSPPAIPDPSSTPPWESIRDHLRRDMQDSFFDARQYCLDSPFVAGMVPLFAYGTTAFPPGRPILEGIQELCQRIHADFVYDPHFTTIATPLQDVFRHRRGVCQDFAHLAIGCLRAIGLSCRYVSGYLETKPPPGKPRLVGADASHAWCSAFIGDLGWVDFDPTNNQMGVDSHITIAWGRDYGDVTPLKGVILGGGEHSLDVSVDAAPLAVD